MTDSIMIDPHVHCRDGKQAYKETIEHVLKVAQEQGVKKIFDMPNTDPPILYEKDVQERLKLVPEYPPSRQHIKFQLKIFPLYLMLFRLLKMYCFR